MAPDPAVLGLGAAAGLALGFFYFGSLWLTVTRAVRSPRPRLLLWTSTALRLGLALAAFYGLLSLGPGCLAAALLGFLVARQVWLAAKGGRRREPKTRGAR